MCVSACVCSRWVIKSGNVRSGGRRGECAVSLLHGGPSVPQQSKMVLLKLRQNRDNRALRDSQQAVSIPMHLSSAVAFRVPSHCLPE